MDTLVLTPLVDYKVKYIKYIIDEGNDADIWFNPIYIDVNINIQDVNDIRYYMSVKLKRKDFEMKVMTNGGYWLSENEALHKSLYDIIDMHGIIYVKIKYQESFCAIM